MHHPALTTIKLEWDGTADQAYKLNTLMYFVIGDFHFNHNPMTLSVRFKEKKSRFIADVLSGTRLRNPMCVKYDTLIKEIHFISHI